MNALAVITRTVRRRAAALALGGLLSAGCTTVEHRPVSVPPGPWNEIHRVAVLSPEVSLHSLSAGGIREEHEEWNEAARTIIKDRVQRLREGRAVLLDELEANPDYEEEIYEVRALYRVVDQNLAIFRHTLPTLSDGHRLSLGTVDRLLAAVDADALLLIYGIDDYFTSDRQALAAVSFLAGAFTGVHIQPSSGVAYLSAALIARDGSILWHSALGQGAIGDLRTPDGVEKTLERLFYHYPLPREPAPASS